jgi:polysaccharide export outer membrane protein
MKKVLSAGVMLLAVASFLDARAQDEPASQQPAVEVTKEAKPKKSKKAGAAAKSPKSSASQLTNEDASPVEQNALKETVPEQKDAASYYEIGMGHYESKRFKDAVEAFKQSIRLGSVEPKTYFNLGQAYYSLQLYREAREAYKRAIRAKQDWAEAHYQLGFMYHILGDKNSSQAQYKVLQTLNPEMAASFQKLLEDTTAPATNTSNNSATVNAAAINKDDGTANNTQAIATDKNQAADKNQSTSQPSIATPDNASNQTTAPSETATNSTGNDPATNSSTNSNGGNQNPASVNASSTTTPAKDEPTAAAGETIAASSEPPATSLYRIGVGDVLDIRLLNAPTSRSTLFTVMSGGLIEYPLVGGSFTVAGLTTDEIGARLSAELKRRGLDGNSQVVVGVRDYTSHAVIVSGLVNYPGTKVLRREAVPLYVIVAEAQLRPDASRAVIMRSSESIPINDLTDPMSLNVLVKPGDVITISARQLQYYFIGGRINSPGQKLYQPGLTLIQSILAAGGLSRSQDTVEISREETDGRLTTTKYVLKEIKSGKIPDPRIQPGDRIEVGH